MRIRPGEAPLVVDDRALAGSMAKAGFHAHLSLEGYPRVRCLLPATWDTGERRLGHHLLYTVFSGTLRITSGSSELLAGAGDAVLLPPAVPFRASSSGGAVRLARLRFGLGKPGRVLAWGNQPRRWRGVGEIEAVLAVAEELLRSRRQGHAEHQAVFALLHSALARAGAAQGLSSAQVERLRQRVATDPACTPADLARELDLTHDYATRLIGRSLGRPPRAFILAERLRLAADRLAAGVDPAEAAAALGWRDHKLFLRQFRAAYGLPPGRWLRHLA